MGLPSYLGSKLRGFLVSTKPSNMHGDNVGVSIDLEIGELREVPNLSLKVNVYQPLLYQPRHQVQSWWVLILFHLTHPLKLLLYV